MAAISFVPSAASSPFSQLSWPPITVRASGLAMRLGRVAKRWSNFGLHSARIAATSSGLHARRQSHRGWGSDCCQQPANQNARRPLGMSLVGAEAERGVPEEVPENGEALGLVLRQVLRQRPLHRRARPAGRLPCCCATPAEIYGSVVPCPSSRWTSTTYVCGVALSARLSGPPRAESPARD